MRRSWCRGPRPASRPTGWPAWLTPRATPCWATTTRHARRRPGPAVAAVALADGKNEEAQTSIKDALAAEAQLRAARARVAPVLLLQLVRVAARAGQPDEAKAVAEAIPDRWARARAQLELYSTKLQELAKAGTAAEASLLEEYVKDKDKVKETVKDTLAYALGQEMWARHNTRLGQRGAVLESAEQLEERFRPLAYVGVALGLQGGSR
jgi:hypothetical protein